MKVIKSIKEIRPEISDLGLAPVGMVPTMGALHEGHLSLVRSIVSRCPLAVVSIFVNPTQFNDKKDLMNYPRTLGNDLAMLENVLRTNDIVFTPEVDEMYPEEDRRVFSFGNLDNVMEALHRPGHFNGVAQIVSKLFDAVKPDVAIFGQKDFQQLAVIKDLVRQTKDKVKILSGPIIREEDGLAMSSRNMLLEPDIRKNAGIIFKTLKQAASMIRDHEIDEIKAFVRKSIEYTKGFSLIYFEIADDRQLIPADMKMKMDRSARYFGCIAVMAGNIRLIDNIEIQLL